MQRNDLFFDLQNIFLKIKINDKVIASIMILPSNPSREAFPRLPSRGADR